MTSWLLDEDACQRRMLKAYDESRILDDGPTLASLIVTEARRLVGDRGDLTVDFLRKNSTKIHFFGLGFVQVKMQDDSRYHFYHPEFRAFTENPHNHRYHFTSTVIRGSLQNHIWKLRNEHEEVPGSVPARLRYESCDPNMEAPGRSDLVRAVKVSSFCTHAGSSYYMDENTFHQVERLGETPCVTHLVRGPKVEPWAMVVHLEGKDDICPFSRKMEDGDLWNIVEDCLL